YLEQEDILKDIEKFVVVVQELNPSQDRKKKEKYAFGDDSSKNLFKRLTGRAVSSEEFDLLQGAKLENWIKKEIEKRDGKIEPPAVKKLAAFVGADLWQMQNEVNKLVSFKVDKLITEKDIDALVNTKIESDIFGAIDALANRQKAAAFIFLHRNLALGESEIALLGMLVYQFRNLLLIKNQVEQGVPFYALGEKLKMHPFVLRKTFEQSKNFSLAGLKKIYERLAEIDLAVKSGQIEPRVALDLVVGEITS
ncbi:MAG: DNA polymerase III subunit delta, partial [Parcubacteria group bacterium LiPW_39]